MFYCREKELFSMEKRYKKGHFECIIIYGRRRVGKTSLINEFCKNKPVVYFSALNASSRENLEALSKAIYTCQNPDAVNAPTYHSYADALDAIGELAVNQRLVFVIDEYPYLAKAEESISSRLQHEIDHKWQNSQLFLILCGSSMSFMEYQVLGYESPLYGRRTAQYKISALNYREMTVFHPELSAEDQALLYGITGGIPHYINKLEVEDDLEEALLENLFDPSAYLFEEPENLLKQELREPAIYNSVISSIAGGASRANEIATKSGLESGVCAKYLKVLLDLGILRKEFPIGEKPGKKTIYQIDDNFFRFWYRFVPHNMSIINAGRIRSVYKQAVQCNLSDYMGIIFEKMCRDYLLLYEQDLPIVLNDVGQWWGTDSENRKEIQIDIVGIPLEGNEYLIGSCKYRNEKIGVDELELLRRYASVFRKNGVFHYYIFSKGGFTQSLLDLAENGEVTLLTLEDIYTRGVN
ncbi:MAG: ATP-binding protein [Lachnospiraceae bacterium]|nr:ATP-binding protein [Lachnospiraceae bacterium]